MRTVIHVILLFALLSTTAAAEQLFVTDELSLDLRRERGTEFRILRMLPAGTAVKVLENSDGWSRVRVDDIEGWILSRFLVNEPAARDRIVAINAEAQRLKKENASLKMAIQETNEHNTALQNDFDSLQSKWDTLQIEHQSLLTSASDPVRLMEANQQLEQKIRELEAIKLRQELDNAVLRTDVQRDWLIAGGGVLGSGLLLGLLLPTLLRTRRRSSEWR